MICKSYFSSVEYFGRSVDTWGALRFLDVRKSASASRSAEGSSILTMLLIIYLSINRALFTFLLEHSSDFVYCTGVFPLLHIIARGFHFDEWPNVDSSGLIFINAPLPTVPIISGRVNYITAYYSWPVREFSHFYAPVARIRATRTRVNDGKQWGAAKISSRAKFLGWTRGRESAKIYATKVGRAVN